MTQQQLAAALATTLSSICRYENGTRIPEPDTMRAIYVFSEGEITPNHFYALPALKVRGSTISSMRVATLEEAA